MGRRWWCGLLLTTHDDHHRRPTFTPLGDVMTTKDAFDRLDALMSRQPPGKKIPPPPAPVRNPASEDDGLAAMWDEMWGLWVPTTTGGLIR